MHLLSALDPLEHVLPHDIFSFHGLHFTNHMLMALISALLMLWIFPKLFNRPQIDAPKGATNFFEAILEFLRIEVFRPALKEHTDRFVPFLWSMFFFILFCNLLGAIPISEFIELITLGNVKHIGGAATGAISTTAALAVVAFFFIHAQAIDTIARDLMNGTYGKHGHHEEHSSDGHAGHESAHDLEHARSEALPADVGGNMRALGDPVAHYDDDRHYKKHPHAAHAAPESEARKMTPLGAILLAIPLYLWNFAPHPFRPQEGESKMKWFADVPMYLFLLALELIGAVIKPFALCVRLFANMVAGHILLAVLIGLIVTVPTIGLRLLVGAPIAGLDLGIQLLEIFVAFLQAYIFTFLTTLFLASAVAPEH
ncbi:MAG TPA: F0F1 ATP synthase subunit A [Tepidisphaeraceae bacterium]|jgi:F0F1-type ATP synthase membrane subunit a|nr:F0F1 ATP synthase subunit A [Tepidisphaeraceae bacterium]